MRRPFLFLSIMFLAITCAPGVARAAVAPAAASSVATPLPLTPANAAKYFAEAAHDCHADDGKLWGVSMCGPMLFVDRVTRRVVASQADAGGQLKPGAYGTFTGTLPPDQTIANTSTTWSGTRWIELMWPLPTDAAKRRTLLAHESYHFVQAHVVPMIRSGDNTQLDTLYGRYTMRLEFRALAVALHSRTNAARRQAADDALLFRAARYHRFPKAQASEVALEHNEGLAEYTGVMVGSHTTAQRKAMALADIRSVRDDPSFVRSFAYATGPAYGLLLNRYRPGWRKQIVHSKAGLAAMLASTLHLDLSHMPLDTLTTRAGQYGGPALMTAETARQTKHYRKIAHYRSILIDGPVLVLPLKHMKVQFDPRNVLSLGKAGTVYPTMRVVDDWGSIDVKKGGLLAPGWHRLTVSAPKGKTMTGTIQGSGWTLKLGPGWRLVPATRKGDFTLRHETSGTMHNK
jgi:hypothetical protein